MSNTNTNIYRSKQNTVTLFTLFVLYIFCWPASVRAQPMPVTIQPLNKIVIYPEITIPAEVITINNSRLSSEITAMITAFPIEVGQLVEKGAPLVELEKRDLQLSLMMEKEKLKALQASNRLADLQLKRAKKLSAQNLISEELLATRNTESDVARANLSEQKIAIRELKRQLSKTVIRAPFKAIIIDKLSHVGELAMPGTNLIHILDADGIKVSAKAQSTDINNLQKAEKIYFSYDNKHLPVAINTITPALDLRERSQEVRLLFKDETALIGTTGYLKWRKKSPHIPAELLIRRGKQLGFFIIKNNKAQFIALPNAEEGQSAPTDLALKTSIVIDGRFALQQGDEVTIKNAQ